MRFVGEFRHALDAKNRLFIPVKLREAGLGDRFYITRMVNETCLGVYTQEEVDEIDAKIARFPDSQVSKLRHFLFSQMMDATPDSNGRIGLSPALIQYAQLDQTAVIVGVGNHVEIWSEKLWTKTTEEMDMDQMRDLLGQVGL